MHFLGFNSQQKRASTKDQHIEADQKKSTNTSTDQDLYAQVDRLQLEMSRLRMKIAFMKANGEDHASINRNGKQEELSHQTFSTRDTTEPRSTPRYVQRTLHTNLANCHHPF
jgi:hypothetical protein